LRVVRRVEPLDLPLASGQELRVVGEELVAGVERATLPRFDLVVSLLTGEEEPAEAFPELMVLDAPLAGAGVEIADSTAGDHDVELIPVDSPDVDRLNDHAFAAQRRRARVPRLTVGLTRELELVTLAALTLVVCDEAVRERVVHGPRGVVPAREPLFAAGARAARVAVHGLILLTAGPRGIPSRRGIAAVWTAPCARGFAAIPEPSRERLVPLRPVALLRLRRGASRARVSTRTHHAPAFAGHATALTHAAALAEAAASLARASALSEAAAALSGRAARVASARAGAREAGLSRHGAAAPLARATAAAAGDRTAAAARERAAGGRARSAARSQAAAARGRAPAGPGDRARRRSAVGRPGGAARDQPDVVLELRADRARGARDEAGGGKQRNRRNRAKSH